MSRIVSLIVLLALVVVIGFLFFQVMFRFFLPMFVALIFVVMFRPLHEWFLEKCKRRNYLAAALTTSTILLIVLLPFAFVLYQAAVEVTAHARNVNVTLVDKLDTLRTKLHLDLPLPETEDALKKLRSDMDILLTDLVHARDTLETHSAQVQAGGVAEALPADPDLSMKVKFAEVRADVDLLKARLGLDKADEATLDRTQPRLAARNLRSALVPIDRFRVTIGELETSHQALFELATKPVPLGEKVVAAEPDPTLVERLTEAVQGSETPQGDEAPTTVAEAAHAQGDDISRVLSDYGKVQQALVGSELMYQIKQFARLDEERIDQLVAQVKEWGTPQLVSLPQRLGGLIGGLLVGLMVMVVSLFYFLADGPGMVKTIMRLSPLDNRYEEQILVEFDKVSRAVVVATLLSAAVQGLLAMVGYWISGLESIFLLSVLTGLLAMVPFVGAASVWSVCSLWLFFDGHIGSAIFLVVYGLLVISTADNVIKPLILHGQSNLHPLLALLSVLGGVQALGPIGIFVGPMVVAFMQAALNMLRVEVTQMTDKAIEVRPSQET